MMKNQDFNSICGFSGDLVGYVYGEIGGDEKRRFETHLSECGSCSEDLSLVSSARHSVGEWFSEEFAALPTPKFHFEPEFESQKPSGWSILPMFAELRFRLPLIAAVSALLIVGAVLFLRSEPIETEVASVPVLSKSPDGGPTAEVLGSSAAPDQSLNSTTVKTVADDSDTPPAPLNDSHRFAASEKASRGTKPRETRAGVRYARTLPSDHSVAEGAQTKLSLNGYEDKEDETLRLEDIFSEIDAS